MYLAVTHMVRQRADEGRFADRARMERFVAGFAGRYLAAERGLARRAAVRRPSWQAAFAAAGRWRPIILQHLLLGMNAHINLDLGVTASELGGGGSIEAVRADFDAVNDVLGELVDGCQAALGTVSPWLGLADRVGGGGDETVIRFSLVAARRQAWSVAVRLSPLAGAERERAIAAVDAATVGVARVVEHPGVAGQRCAARRAGPRTDRRRPTSCACWRRCVRAADRSGPHRSGGGSGRSGISMSSPRCRRTARVIAFVPKRTRTSSSAASRAPAPPRSNGSVSCTAPSSSRLATASPISVRPRSSISGPRLRRAALGRWPGSPTSRPSAGPGCASGWPGCSRRSAAAARPCGRSARPLRRRRVTRSARATSEASMSSAECGPRPDGPLRSDRSAAPADLHGARVAVVGQGVEVAPGGRAEHGDERALAERRRPRRRSRCRGRGAWRRSPARRPTAARRAAGGGTPARRPARTSSSPSGLATPLATLARNLVRATPTVIGRPTVAQHVAAQAGGDLDRRAGDPPQAADVEERLVDGQALDERRGVLEHLEHRRAGVDVGREPGRHDDGVGAQPPGLVPAHRRAHAERLGLVAGGEHDAAADDDRAAPQAGVVALLDGGVEGVEIGVQDRRLRALTNTCSHSCQGRTPVGAETFSPVRARPRSPWAMPFDARMSGATIGRTAGR